MKYNPHFFCNVLNFVYGRTRKSDPDLTDVIMLLYKMMRYAKPLQQGYNHNASESTDLENLRQRLDYEYGQHLTIMLISNKFIIFKLKSETDQQ